MTKLNAVRILVLVFFAIGMVNAASLTFHGTLKPPAGPIGPRCSINNGKTLEVSFGHIIADKIDGSNYLTKIDWNFSCVDMGGESVTNVPLKLTYSGTVTGYSPDAITTSTQGLGIELQQNGNSFHPGETLVFNGTTPPTLKAVPVKQPGITLSEGNFEAWAMLVMEFQ